MSTHRFLFNLLIPVLLALQPVLAASLGINTGLEYDATSTRIVGLSKDLYINAEKLGEFHSFTPIIGQQDVLVIFVYFTDVAPSVDVYDIVSKLLGTRRYFSEVSYGQVYMVWLSYDWGSPWLQLPNDMTYYGAPGNGHHDGRWYEFIEDSLAVADPYVDYTQYSYVLIVHAGGDEASTGDPNDIWSFAVWGVSWWTDDGKVQLNIAVVSEQDPIGVIAHELGHSVFRWPDLYDYSHTQEFVGHWGLMASGAWNNDGDSPAHPVSWCRLKAGWIGSSGIVEVQPGSSISVELSALENPAGIKVVKIPLDAQHYYLVESRIKTGFDAYLPGEGVLILYVDETLDSGEGIVRVVDSTPGDGDVDDGQWVVGQMFSDETNDVQIYVHSRAKDVYTISIQYAPATGGQPELSLEFDNAPAGVYVGLEGSGFSPNAKVSIYFDTQFVGEDWTDSYGWFYTTIRIPVDTSPGQHLIRAVDQYGVEKSVTFTVNLVEIQLSQDTVKPGDAVLVSVSGLGPRIFYWVKLDDMLLFMLDSNYSGWMIFNFTVPPLTAGTHRLRIIYPGFWTYEELVEVGSVEIYVQDGTVLASELEARIREVVTYIDSVKAELTTELAMLAAQLQLLNETLSANITLLSYRLDALNSSLQQLGIELSRLDETVEELNQTLLRLDENLAELADTLGSRIVSLNATLTQISETLETALSKIRLLNETLKNTEATLKQQIQSITNSLEQLSAKTNQLRSDLDELSATLETLQGTLNQHVSSAEQTFANLQQNLNNLEDTLRQQAGKTEQLDQALQVLRDETSQNLAKLSGNLTTAEQKIDQLQQANQQLEKQLQQAKTLNMALTGIAIALASASLALAKRK